MNSIGIMSSFPLSSTHPVCECSEIRYADLDRQRLDWNKSIWTHKKCRGQLTDGALASCRQETRSGTIVFVRNLKSVSIYENPFGSIAVDKISEKPKLLEQKSAFVEW